MGPQKKDRGIEYPALESLPTQEKKRLSRREATMLLKINFAQIANKFLAVGLLDEGEDGKLSADAVHALAERAYLGVTDGELTVLRMPGPSEAADAEEGREKFGVSLELTDEELASRTLGWWRGTPERILNNELFVVTTGTIPIAVWALEGVVNSLQEGEGNQVRYLYRGRCLSRAKRRDEVTDRDRMLIDDPRLGFCVTYDSRYVDKKDSGLIEALRMIMSHRIQVAGLATIGYLNAGTPTH